MKISQKMILGLLLFSSSLIGMTSAPSERMSLPYDQFRVAGVLPYIHYTKDDGTPGIFILFGKDLRGPKYNIESYSGFIGKKFVEENSLQTAAREACEECFQSMGYSQNDLEHLIIESLVNGTGLKSIVPDNIFPQTAFLVEYIIPLNITFDMRDTNERRRIEMFLKRLEDNSDSRYEERNPYLEKHAYALVDYQTFFTRPNPNRQKVFASFVTSDHRLRARGKIEKGQIIENKEIQLDRHYSEQETLESTKRTAEFFDALIAARRQKQRELEEQRELDAEMGRLAT